MERGHIRPASSKAVVKARLHIAAASKAVRGALSNIMATQVHNRKGVAAISSHNPMEDIPVSQGVDILLHPEGIRVAAAIAVVEDTAVGAGVTVEAEEAVDIVAVVVVTVAVAEVVATVAEVVMEAGKT